METRIKLKSKRDCKDLAARMDGYNVNSMVCGYEKKTDACQVSYKIYFGNNFKKSNFIFREILVSLEKIIFGNISQ